MKKTFKTITAIAMVFTVALTGCKKEAGPKGDKGDKGDAGINGVNGNNGTNGTNGVANIQVVIATTANGSWIFDSNDNSWNASLNAPQVTSAVVSSGDVRVFLGDGTATAWSALPLSYGTIQINYSYILGAIGITMNTSDFSVIPNPGGMQFKFVIIPPAYKVKYPNIDWNNYNEIEKLINLN